VGQLYWVSIGTNLLFRFAWTLTLSPLPEFVHPEMMFVMTGTLELTRYVSSLSRRSR
jgi:hypothetical protein